MGLDIPQERLNELRLRLADYTPFFGRKLFEKRNINNHYFRLYYKNLSRLCTYNSISAALFGIAIGTTMDICLEKLIK